MDLRHESCPPNIQVRLRTEYGNVIVISGAGSSFSSCDRIWNSVSRRCSNSSRSADVVETVSSNCFSNLDCIRSVVRRFCWQRASCCFRDSISVCAALSCSSGESSGADACTLSSRTQNHACGMLRIEIRNILMGHMKHEMGIQG